MKPFLGAQSVIRVGVESIIESDTPDGTRGVVFEDDGDTGYFYARDYSRPGELFVDALHVYNAEVVTDSERPSTVKIIWTRDFKNAALLINQMPHVIFDFNECCGYAKSPFPAPDPNSGWKHEVLNPGLRERFHPKNEEGEQGGDGDAEETV